jgi:hypothetical protein
MDIYNLKSRNGVYIRSQSKLYFILYLALGFFFFFAALSIISNSDKRGIGILLFFVSLAFIISASHKLILDTNQKLIYGSIFFGILKFRKKDGLLYNQFQSIDWYVNRQFRGTKLLILNDENKVKPLEVAGPFKTENDLTKTSLLVADLIREMQSTNTTNP